MGEATAIVGRLGILNAHFQVRPTLIDCIIQAHIEDEMIRKLAKEVKLN